MRIHIKTPVAILLCVIAVIWMIPTVFVRSTISEIKSYELIKSEQNADTYRIIYTYERDGKTLEGSYRAKYLPEYVPMVGEEDVCHYLTLPPYPVFRGDAPSPVPPLVLLVIGVLVYVIDFKKIYEKMVKKNVSKA